MIKDYFILAFRNLKKRKLRSWLTMIGIFLSIATIFILISLSLGLQNAVQEQFEILGTDKFFIMPNTGLLGVPGTIGGVILTEKDVDVIKKVQGVKDFSYTTLGNVKMKFAGQTKYFLMAGLPLDRMEVFSTMTGFEAIDGKMLEEGDSGKIVLGYLYSYGNIFKRAVKVGNSVEINDKKFKVIGIAERIGNPQDDSNIYISIGDFRELLDIPERVDQIIIQVDEGEDVLEVAERVEKKLRNARDQTEKTQDFSISTPESLLESFQNILQIITVFLAGIAAISLLVGAIGISNTMYTSVIERTKEIGIMKAIGAKNSDILFIFLIESGLLGLTGAIIGVILGFGVSKIIEYIAINQLGTNLLRTASPLWLIVGCLIFGFIIGGLSGTFPAWRASKTNVVDALRYE